jgi:hypothetical protein
LSPEGTITFRNAAVDAGVAAPPREYRAAWFLFDNTTGESRATGETTGQTTSIAAPAQTTGSVAADGFVRVDISAIATDHPTWATPVRAYFKRGDAGWKLVGLERMD